MERLTGLTVGLALLGLWAHPVNAAARTGFTATPVKARSGINETNAALGAGALAWDQERHDQPGRYDLFVHVRGVTTRVNRTWTQGLGGGADGGRLVFIQMAGGRDRVVRYDLATGKRARVSPLDSFPGRQFHPTISGNWILLHRQLPGGATTVVLYNTRTRAIRVLARGTSSTNSVYAGEVSGNYAVWGRARAHSWDVFLYDIAKRATTLIRRPPGVSFQYTPAVTPVGTVYYAIGRSGCGQDVRIVRRSLNGTTTQLLTLPYLHDTGYMWADQSRRGVTTLLFDRSTCADRAHYAAHPWDVYEIQNAGAPAPASEAPTPRMPSGTTMSTSGSRTFSERLLAPSVA
jgi:hypothetical protein